MKGVFYMPSRKHGNGIDIKIRLEIRAQKVDPREENFSRMSYRDSKPLSSSGYESGTLPTLSYVTMTCRDNTSSFLFAFTSALYTGLKCRKSSECLIRPRKSSTDFLVTARRIKRCQIDENREDWGECEVQSAMQPLPLHTYCQPRPGKGREAQTVPATRSDSERAEVSLLWIKSERESHTPRAERLSPKAVPATALFLLLFKLLVIKVLILDWS